VTLRNKGNTAFLARSPAKCLGATRQMSVPNGAPKICRNERGPMPMYIGITLGVPFGTLTYLLSLNFVKRDVRLSKTT